MINPKEFAEKMGQIAEERDDTEVCHKKWTIIFAKY